jgi:quercetin dioxygenase-like cupin family protein
VDHTEAVASLEREGLSVSEWTDDAGTHYPEHSHVRDEVLVMIEGSLTMDMAGERRTLGPGDRIELPAGAVHTATVGPNGARYLVGR